MPTFRTAGVGLWMRYAGQAVGDKAGTATATPASPGAGGTVPVQQFIDLAVAQQNKTYSTGARFGPDSFDCSGLIKFCCDKLGIPMGGTTSDSEYEFCVGSGGTDMPVDQGHSTPGALLVRYPGAGPSGHIAISLGDGRNMAANSSHSNPQVGITSGGTFTKAVTVPGIDYSAGWNGNTGGAGGTGGLGGNKLLGPEVFNPQADPTAQYFRGYRAMMDDAPVLPYIDGLLKAAQRAYCSAPNGDFIAWFPDYFDEFGTAGKMVIEDIEILQDFSIVWNDEALKTHVFTAGSEEVVQTADGGTLPGAAVDPAYASQTAGVATVEFQEVLDALVNTESADGVFADAKTIFQRFGARPYYEQLPNVANQSAEFFFALRIFQKNWAEQFSGLPRMTFMPELFPGMIAQFPGQGFQAYVHQVTHRFDFEEGGGFTTDALLIAPSSTQGGFFGFVKGGNTDTVTADGGQGDPAPPPPPPPPVIIPTGG